VPEFELPQVPQIRVFRDVIFTWEHRNAKGELIGAGIRHLDLVPNQGLNWISSQLAGTTTGAGTVMCLGTGTSNPTMGDTTLGGEITGSGMSRQSASTTGVGVLTGLAAAATTNQTTGSYYVYTTFTASGSVTVNEAGLSPSSIYNAGIVVHDLLSPAASMAAGDTLTPSFQFIL
jgi:hypothetical protein